MQARTNTHAEYTRFTAGRLWGQAPVIINTPTQTLSPHFRVHGVELCFGSKRKMAKLSSEGDIHPREPTKRGTTTHLLLSEEQSPWGTPWLTPVTCWVLEGTFSQDVRARLLSIHKAGREGSDGTAPWGYIPRASGSWGPGYSIVKPHQQIPQHGKRKRRWVYWRTVRLREPDSCPALEGQVTVLASAGTGQGSKCLPWATRS